MGKSRLRNKSDWEPRGNGRNLVDRDGVPEGCDPDIWHLALYFEQRCEEVGLTSNGRPVIYSELKNRLTKFDPSAIRACARTSGISLNWVSIVEHMIDTFFTIHDYDNSYIINTFCGYELFEYLVHYVIESLEREQLLLSNNKIPQPDREIKPSRRTEEQKEIAKITNKIYSPEELTEKMLAFKNRDQ